MPNIREAGANTDLGLRPSETGVEARAGAARRIGMFYNQAGDAMADTGARIGSTVRDVGDLVEKYETNREINKGAADGAQLFSNLTAQWNQTAKNADPNDPGVAQKFRDEVLEPELQKFSAGFNTERSGEFAERQVEKLRNHFFEKTTADMASLAAQAVSVNAKKMINNLASTVASDPSALDTALDLVSHKVDGMAGANPNLTADAAGRLKESVLQDAKETIVKSAIAGMIQKNPNIDLDKVQQKYGPYINGAEMKMFQKAAQTQAKADLLQQKQLETYQRQQQERQANDAMTKVMTDNMSVDPSGKIVINPDAVSQTLDIARKFPEAGPAPARAMIDFIEAQHNKEMKAVDDPATVSALQDRMFSADNPTTSIDLMKARAQGKISDHTFAVLHDLTKELEQTPLKGPVWQDTIGAVKGELVLSGVGIAGKDIAGETNYAKWAQTFIPQYIAKSRAGTLEPNALDVKDPNSMISKSMAPFKRTVQERVQDYLSTLGGTGSGAPARSVGGVPVPPALGGVAALQYNPTTRQWRDQTSGQVYDSAGAPVR